MIKDDLTKLPRLRVVAIDTRHPDNKGQCKYWVVQEHPRYGDETISSHFFKFTAIRAYKKKIQQQLRKTVKPETVVIKDSHVHE